MYADFAFFGFTPTKNLKSKANITLGRLLDRSPFGSQAVATMEFDGETHYCSVEIYSQYGPFIAKASHQNAMKALEQVNQRLMAKLNAWSERRFSALSA